MWLLNVLLTSRSTCVMSLEETRASSFISCGKTGEEEQASGTETRPVKRCRAGQGALGTPWEWVCRNLVPCPRRPGMAGVPTEPMGPVWGPVHSCCGRGGDWGSAWVGGDRGSARVGRGLGGVVPKIANRRNHREADTDANTWGFIYKLELVSMYTRHSGAGTWTPRWVLA